MLIIKSLLLVPFISSLLFEVGLCQLRLPLQKHSIQLGKTKLRSSATAAKASQSPTFEIPDKLHSGLTGSRWYHSSPLVQQDHRGTQAQNKLKDTLMALKRTIHRTDKDIELKACTEVRNKAGTYSYYAPASAREPDVDAGFDDVTGEWYNTGEVAETTLQSEEAEPCTLLLVGEPDQRIALEFYDFDVDCEHGALLAIVDGWESYGQLFPGSDDHQLSPNERYHGYCGSRRPVGKFLSTQNAAQIQYLIPTGGQGFRVRVEFISVPSGDACNVIWTNPIKSKEYRMSNMDGRAINCSVLFLNPERIEILVMDVGVKSTSAATRRRTSSTTYARKKMWPLKRCAGLHDYVSVLGGTNFEPTYMRRYVNVCGSMKSPEFRDKPSANITCSYTVVRLVSSGQFYNSVTFHHSQITTENSPMFDSEAACSAPSF